MNFNDLLVKNKYAIYCANQDIYETFTVMSDQLKLDKDNKKVNSIPNLQFILTDTGKLVTLDDTTGYKIVYPVLYDEYTVYHDVFSFIPLTYEEYTKLYSFLYGLINTDYSRNVIRITSVKELRTVASMIMDISKDKNTGMRLDIIRRMVDKLNNSEAIYIHIDNFDKYTDITNVGIHEVDLDGIDRSDYKLYRVIV